MGTKRKFSEDEEDSLEQQPTDLKEDGVSSVTAAPKVKKELPSGYVCNACGAIGQHAIYECPQKISKKKQKKEKAEEAVDSAIPETSTVANNNENATSPSPATGIKTIFLSGLPFDITKDRLLKTIESISDAVCNLSLRNITLLCFPDNPNRCRGIGYINCENDDDFQRCLQLQGMQIGKMTISAQESNLPAKQPHHESAANLGPSGMKGNNAAGKKKEKGPPRCYRCGQLHDPNTCTNERICYKCRQPGHLSSQCTFKKAGKA